MESYHNIKRDARRGHPAAAPAPAAGPEAREVTILMHLPRIRSPALLQGTHKNWKENAENENLNSNA